MTNEPTLINKQPGSSRKTARCHEVFIYCHAKATYTACRRIIIRRLSTTTFSSCRSTKRAIKASTWRCLLVQDSCLFSLCSFDVSEPVSLPLSYYYSALDRAAEYYGERVCLCVLVCPRSYLRNCTSDLHQFFCPCYLWPWLSPPLAE